MEQNLRKSVEYIVKASLVAGLVYVIALVLPVEQWTSQVTAAVLTFFGMPAHCHQQYGQVYLDYLQISIDCTAMEVIAIFVGLVAAADAAYKKRVVFAVFCSATVFLANIFRISIVYYLLEKGMPWWLAHDLFSGGLAILAGMIFLLISEQYIPYINEALYCLLDAVEQRITRKR